MKSNRIQVRGTGNQAPYGIGEIIEDYPDTKAGLLKAWRHAARWYNKASVTLINDNWHGWTEEELNDCARNR